MELITIAKLISANDADIVQEIESCLEDTQAYFENHREQFEERGIDDWEEVEEVEEIQWLTMVDALMEKQYVCECDWSEELENFLYVLGELKGIQEKGLQMESDWFEEDGEISVWCEVLEEKWKEEGCCVAAIDIESDSYVLFPYEIEKMSELCELAETMGCRIDFAKNM